MNRHSIHASICLLAATALLVTALSACASASVGGSVAAGEQASFEGEVLSIDTEPWTYDGHAVVMVAVAGEGEVSVQLPARWNLCRAEAPDLESLSAGDRVQVAGTVGEPGEVVVCEQTSHHLRGVGAEVSAPTVTTIFVVRHAEKGGQGRDPELSLAGHARADLLARVLADEPVDAVFATDYQRTQQTAAPTAANRGVEVRIYDAGNATALASEVMREQRGKRVLVVGHSNTVDDIAAAFGASGLQDLAETEFDRLLLIHHDGRRALLTQLRYGPGNETPAAR